METDIVIFEESLIIDSYEIVVSIKHETIIKYMDAFYAVSKGWKERIIILQGKHKNKTKLTIVKNKKQQNGFSLEDNVVFLKLTENSFAYLITSLMKFHHFKTRQIDHLHVECYDAKRENTYDFTLVFET